MKDVDSLRARAASLARNERYFGGIQPLVNEIAALEKVDAAKLQQLATTWITPYNLSLAMLGDLKGREDLTPRTELVDHPTRGSRSRKPPTKSPW